ncbi:MAG: hypothetical protein ACE5HB_04555 [Terriglobia bacterium]
MERLPFDPYDFFGYLASGLLAVVGMDLTLGFPRVLGQDLKVVDSAVLLLGIYVTGQIIATPAKALLEDGLVEKVLCRPSINLFRERRPWIRGLLFPGFYKPFPEHTRRKVLSRAKSEDVRDTGEALFLHVRYSPQILRNEKLMAKLDTFINKYGFTRNLAFTSLAVGIALAVKTGFAPNPELTRYAATALVAGVFLLYRYLKFFRQYSYEMFNNYASGK